MNNDSPNPLFPVVQAWLKKIDLAYQHKKQQFQDDADEAMNFFNGPYDWMYGIRHAGSSRGFVWVGDEDELPRPSFAMTVNKVAELVQIFGPALYHRNPNRQVNPRKLPVLEAATFGDPNDPMVQQMYAQLVQRLQSERAVDRARAALLEFYLNFTPDSLDLKTESRWAIDEAIIKGQGVLWTEPYHPPTGGMKMVGSFYDTVDNLVVDPDGECQSNAKWIARRCVHPYWEVEKMYGLPPNTLKDRATLESYTQTVYTDLDKDGDYQRKRGLTNDLLVYWKIYSRMGLGGRLSGVTPDLRQPLDVYGDNVFLVVSEGCPYPLNLPPEFVAAADDPQIQEKISWPTPFWADDQWPYTSIIFHPVARKVWPMSHLKPAMGELKFINWAYSFLAGKIKVACRDFIGIAKSTGEELKKQIQNGQDYTIIEIEAIHGDIDKVVKFLQHPAFNKDIYEVIDRVTQNFEKRTGLTELVYGETGSQMRSAQEAQVKENQLNVRPDDMANVVEDAMSAIARKEALAARWHLQGQDIEPIMGGMGAQWWGEFVQASNPAEILHQLEYRIEAGSVRKPNRARDQANANQAMQVLLQPFFAMAQAGQVGPFNALIGFWAKTLDLDASQFQLKPPPPPMPLGPPGMPPGAPPGPGAHPGPPAPPPGARPQGPHPMPAMPPGAGQGPPPSARKAG